MAEATSLRGQSFLIAYYQATDETGDPFCDDEPLAFLPEEFEALQRQVSLAGVSIGKLEDFSDHL